MPQGIPAKGGIGNSILYAGDPVIREFEVLTATSMYPGRLVQTDTTNYQIKVGASDSALILGVLDRESTELYTTIYGAGDQARVLSGDIIVWVVAASGATIGVGTRLYSAGSGLVDEDDTSGVSVGYSLHVKTGDDNEWILMKCTI